MWWWNWPTANDPGIGAAADVLAPGSSVIG